MDLLIDARQRVRYKPLIGDIIVRGDIEHILVFLEGRFLLLPQQNGTFFLSSLSIGLWSSVMNKPAHVGDPPHEIFQLFIDRGRLHILKPQLWQSQTSIPFMGQLSIKVSRRNTKSALQSLQVILPTSREDIPQIINMVIDFYGLYNDVINISLKEIMQHTVENGSHRVLVSGTRILKTKRHDCMMKFINRSLKAVFSASK